MQQVKDKAIVLARIDYGEKDRILTLLTQGNGKISVLAKGSRGQKSRLAGGIELLSETAVIYINGRSQIKTLTSARLIEYFDQIVSKPACMHQSFEYIKAVSKIVEENTGQEYYPIILQALRTLNSNAADNRVIDIWFSLHVLRLSGSAPNLRVGDIDEIEGFEFDYDHQKFVPRQGGAFSKNDLKLLRLCITQAKPPVIENDLDSADRLQALCRSLMKFNVTEV